MQRVLLCLIMIVSLLACGSKEERRDAFFQNGLRLEAEGRIADARIEARNAIKLDPNHPGSYLLLARCAVKDQYWREAYASYTRAFELDPANVEAMLGLGRLHLLANDTTKVEELAMKVLESQPSSTDGHLLLAGAMLKANRMQEAEKTLRQVLTKDPGNEDAILILSATFVGQGRNQDAMATVREGLAARPDSRALLLRAAGLAAGDGDMAEAEKYLMNLRQRDPEDAQVMTLLAGLYERMGENARAQEMLRGILSLNPGSEDARLRLMENLVRSGRPDDAVALAGDAPNGPSPRLRLAVADIYLAVGRTDEAEKNLASLAGDVTAGPTSLEARLRLSEIMLRKGDKDGALREIDTVLQQNPEDVRGHASRGRILMFMGRHQEALGNLLIAMKESPSDVNIALLLARAQRALGDNLQATEGLRAFLEKNPDALPARLALAAHLERQGNSNTALEVLRDGNATVLELAMGDLEARLGHTKEAERHFRQAAMTPEGEVSGTLRLGNLQANRREWPAARATFEAILKKYPETLAAAEGIVAVEVAAGRPAEALTWAKQYAEKRKEDPRAADLLGRLSLRTGDKDGAEKAFREAQRRDPNWSVPSSRLARLYAASGRMDIAIAEAREVLAKKPDAVAEALLLGQLLQLGGESAEAETLYRSLLARDPNLLPVANNLAYLLATPPDVAPDRLAEALSLATKASAGGDPAAFDTLGWIHYRLGDRPTALTHLRKAHEALPEDATVVVHLARVLAEDGMKAEARDALNRLLARNRDFPEHKEAMKLLESL